MPCSVMTYINAATANTSTRGRFIRLIISTKSFLMLVPGTWYGILKGDVSKRKKLMAIRPAMKR